MRFLIIVLLVFLNSMVYANEGIIITTNSGCTVTSLTSIMIPMSSSVTDVWRLKTPDIYRSVTIPAVTDDANDGYREGDIWVDETNDRDYVCVDTTVGASVWRQIDSSGGLDKVVREVPKIIYKEEKQMGTLSLILLIMVVCIITVKVVIPKLTLRNIVRAFVGLIWKPAKKNVTEVKKEWDDANKE